LEIIKKEWRALVRLKDSASLNSCLSGRDIALTGILLLSEHRDKMGMFLTDFDGCQYGPKPYKVPVEVKNEDAYIKKPRRFATNIPEVVKEFDQVCSGSIADHIHVPCRGTNALHSQSEVGGSEFAFRQAPRNREIVSCRACVRAEPMLGGNASQT
jgi:hypothetical protein